MNVALTTLLLMPSCWPRIRSALAIPLMSVLTCNVLPPFSVPPPVSTVKVTGTYATGLPPASRTSNSKGAGNAWPTIPVCPSPISTTIFAGGPTVEVSQNSA